MSKQDAPIFVCVCVDSFVFFFCCLLLVMLISTRLNRMIASIGIGCDGGKSSELGQSSRQAGRRRRSSSDFVGSQPSIKSFSSRLMCTRVPLWPQPPPNGRQYFPDQQLEWPWWWWLTSDNAIKSSTHTTLASVLKLAQFDVDHETSCHRTTRSLQAMKNFEVQGKPTRPKDRHRHKMINHGILMDKEEGRKNKNNS